MIVWTHAVLGVLIICMCFIFLYLHLLSAVEQVSPGKAFQKYTHIIIIIVIVVVIITIRSQSR